MAISVLCNPYFMDTSQLKQGENNSDEEESLSSSLSFTLEGETDLLLEQLYSSMVENGNEEITRSRDVSSSVSEEGPISDDRLSVESSSAIPSLPEFDMLLPEGSPKPKRKSKSPKKVAKKPLPPSREPGTHPVSRQRLILPKIPSESIHSQSTSGIISPSSPRHILTHLSGGTSISDPATQTSSYSSLEESDEDWSSVEPQPSTSGLHVHTQSEIPLTFDSASSTSSSQGSPTLTATTEEVVKVFTYEEDESVKQAAAASEQSKSFMPLIKEELRTKIQLKRLLSGEDEPEVEFKKPESKERLRQNFSFTNLNLMGNKNNNTLVTGDYRLSVPSEINVMSLDEVKKRERKKEQNRRAALKSRQKQSKQEEEIIQRYKKQEKLMKELTYERQRLLEEKRKHVDRLNLHIHTECQLESREEDAKTLHLLQETETQQE